ncbi:MAG: toxin FitB [Acetobacteraceae bacterium]|nr:toxin FitB [Acetobacteraceae bacterium]
MNGWLLDTKVLSEVIKRRPEPKVVQFIAAQPIDRLLISVVTFAEIRYGIERVTDVIRRAQLGDWLSNRIRPMFLGRALPISEDVMLKWRLLLEQGRAAGHAFPQPDLIIAATALLHGLTIVTRTVAILRAHIPPVFNPWTDETPP